MNKNQRLPIYQPYSATLSDAHFSRNTSRPEIETSSRSDHDDTTFNNQQKHLKQLISFLSIACIDTDASDVLLVISIHQEL